MQPRLLIVTGLSGAGKSTVIRCLEDLGFFCIDNLPPGLISKFTELCSQASGNVQRVALVIDIRGGEFFQSVSDVLAQIKKQGIKYEILYLEASNETLVRRFKESRRPHPLSPGGEIIEGIEEERRVLREMRGLADKIIDTSNLTVAQLKEEITNLYGEGRDDERLAVTIVSFGYKYGIPLDADLVIDVRFLPNPYYDATLRPLSGFDDKVKAYVFSSPVTADFMQRFKSLLEFLIPHYIKEGKSTLTIAIGCTGGMHRSVALVNYLGEILKDKYRVAVRHRDLKGS